jgi:hypothetical protein
MGINCGSSLSFGGVRVPGPHRPKFPVEAGNNHLAGGAFRHGPNNRRHAVKLDESTRNSRAMSGALSIMMRSGAILDFELVVSDGELFVRVWTLGGREEAHLGTHVAALGYVDERHVIIEKRGDVSKDDC